MKRLEKIEHLRKKWIREEEKKEKTEEEKSPPDSKCTEDLVQMPLSKTNITSSNKTSLSKDIQNIRGGGPPWGPFLSTIIKPLL